MPVVSINGSLSINEEELSDFVRSEIDSSDFGELMGDAVSEAMSEYDYDTMVDNIQELDASLDRHDDRLDDVERSINELMESGTSPSNGPVDVSPEVDAALKKQHERTGVLETFSNRHHKRIEELEHAVLCIFEYLHSARQQNLGRSHERFNDSLKGGE